MSKELGFDRSKMLSFILRFNWDYCFYLNKNIVNVGEFGTALHLLVLYVVLSVIIFLALSLKKTLYVGISF